MLPSSAPAPVAVPELDVRPRVQTMRLLRAIVLIPLSVLSVWFLIDYARELYPMYQMMDYPGFVFLREPYVGYYPAAHSPDGHGHWSLMETLDGNGEGRAVIHCFPCWPLALAAVGILVYSPFAVFRRRPNEPR